MLPQMEPPSVRLPGFGRLQLKYVALLALVGQTVGAIFILRASRLQSGTDGLFYLNTTAVCLSEVFKLLGSLVLVWMGANYSIQETGRELHESIIAKPMETLKVGVPAFIYTIQNNLIFIALSNMSPAMYQITYQLKILMTAVLTVLMLNRSLGINRWISLFVLTVGVSLIQLPSGTSLSENKPVGDFTTGLGAVLLACLTSGFAGVYFEKILKGSSVSIWVRNIQLAIFGSVLALIGCLWSDGTAIQEHGFFQGYTVFTWMAILIQSAGGLIVAAVLKYADNLLKCFGNAAAIVISCFMSYALYMDFELSQWFIIGTGLVVFSTYSYGVDLQLTKCGRQAPPAYQKL